MNGWRNNRRKERRKKMTDKAVTERKKNENINVNKWKILKERNKKHKNERKTTKRYK